MVGAFLTPMSGFGGETAASFAQENRSRMEFDALETHSFEPADEFLKCSVDSEKIREYIGKYPTKSVYMITGIKIAKGAKCVASARQEGGVKAKVGVDAMPLTGVPVKGGPRIKIGTSGLEESWFGVLRISFLSIDYAGLSSRSEGR
jgi:hypothetical protein